MSNLHLVFIDELTIGEPGGLVSFGRTADITVDEANPYMHRIVGVFFHQDNVWWIANKSKHSLLTLVSKNGNLARLPSDGVAALTDGEGIVRFEAGPSTYEIGWSLPASGSIVPPSMGDQLVEDPEATHQFGVVEINDEQRLLLVALAEPHLRDTTARDTDIPSNASVAHRLGWSPKKLDRKLDYLCARLDGEGVRGLRGAKGGEAVDRRLRLVEHAISSGMVAADDLDLLPEPRT